MARRKVDANDSRRKYDGMYQMPGHPNPESKYFETWGDFLGFVEAVAGRGQGASVRSDSHRSEWTQSRSMAHCLELARNGWAEGENIAQPLCAEILNKVTSLVEVNVVNYDVEGIGLDVATYLSGEPECWQRFDKVTGEGEGIRHMRIVLDATVSSEVDQRIITARGAAVAALVQALEYAGCRVQLEVMPLCNGHKWESRVLVKSADQDLDMSRVIFATAHPAMLRRLGFATQEGCPSMDGNWGYGPCTVTVMDKGDLYITSGMLGEPQWDNTKSATEWVLREMVKQGIKFTA